MVGIKTDDFEIMLRKNTAILSDLSDSFSLLKDDCSSILSNFNSLDLGFISNKFNSGLGEFDNITKKMECYQNVLQSVYNSYSEQNSQIVRDVKNLIS